MAATGNTVIAIKNEADTATAIVNARSSNKLALHALHEQHRQEDRDARDGRREQGAGNLPRAFLHGVAQFGSPSLPIAHDVFERDDRGVHDEPDGKRETSEAK